MLEPAPYVDAHLYGATFLRKASAHGFKVERLVILVQGVVHPDTDLPVSFVQAEASVQCAVEGLTGVVLLCPVDTSCRPVVGIEGDVVQNGILAEREDILSAYGKGMFRYDGT